MAPGGRAGDAAGRRTGAHRRRADACRSCRRCGRQREPGHECAGGADRPRAGCAARRSGSAPGDVALPAAPPAWCSRSRPRCCASGPTCRPSSSSCSAAAARVEQADADRLPSLSLGGSIGLNALSLGALGSGAGVASLLASVSVPVFDGGRLQAQVRQQEAARDEAAAAYRATVLAALQEVEDALVSLSATREQLAAQQAAAAVRALPPPRWPICATAAAWWTSRTCCRPSARCSWPTTA